MRLTILTLALTLAACGDDSDGNRADGTSETSDATQEASDTRDTRDAEASETRVPCDPVLQTGCDAGQNCTYIGAETDAYCIAAGEVPANFECDNVGDCQRGVCMSINQTGSRCYQLCGADTDCGAGTANECLDLDATPFKVCKIPGLYEQCNLLTQNCADPAKACYRVNGEEEPICLRAGEGALGSECNSAAACINGNLRVNDVCRAICDPDAPNACGATATCRNYFDDAGYCAPN